MRRAVYRTSRSAAPVKACDPSLAPRLVCQNNPLVVRPQYPTMAVQSKRNTSGFRLMPSSPSDLGVFAAKENIQSAKAGAAAGIAPE
jgi:hypothetical protein